MAAVIKGSYKSILDYVDRIQKLERLVTVDSLEINRTACSCGTEQDLTVNFTFTAYFEPAYRKDVEIPLLPYAESSAHDY